jgi:hypothetical protein
MRKLAISAEKPESSAMDGLSLPSMALDSGTNPSGTDLP